MQSIGEKLRKVRERKGLTQEELSARVTDITGQKVSRQTISMWESGINRPTVHNLLNVARALGLSLGELMADHEEQAPQAQQPPAPIFVPLLMRSWIVHHEKDVLAGNFEHGLTINIPWTTQSLSAFSSVKLERPFATFVDDDHLESLKFYNGDVVILTSNRRPKQGVPALIRHYGVLALWLVYDMPDCWTLLQNDINEIRVTKEEKQQAGVYTYLGSVVGSIRVFAKPQPLIRRQ